MADKKDYLTKEKYAELQKELEDLKTNKRKEVAEHLEYAKALGDLSENAEYHEAREEQAMIEDRIQKLEDMLKSAEIVSMHHTEAIGIGSTVMVEKNGGGDKIKYKVVGSEEADLSQGRLSIRSPLGEAMVGKTRGDSFTLKTPNGRETKYKIVEIE